MTRNSSPRLRAATLPKSAARTCRAKLFSFRRSRVILRLLAAGILIYFYVVWTGCGSRDVFSFTGHTPWASPNCSPVISSIIMRLKFVADMLWAFLFAASATATSSALLPSYPLAVKSPYLSTWVPGNQLSDAATAQPQFWTNTALTWPVLARVDGTAYALFGSPGGLTGGLHAATTDSVSYSSLHTCIRVNAGGVNFTLDYFTPVYPKKTDYLVHSLPYSYLTVGAATSGYETKDVQVFSAIDQTWTAQNGAANLNFTTSGDVSFFQFHNPNEIPFTESSDMATWGSIVFGTTTKSKATFECNDANSVYSSFVSGGSLINSYGSCSNTHLAGIAQDLGTVGSSGVNATFAVGFDRPQAVNYLGKAQTGYYRTRWPTIAEALSYFLDNYSSAYAYSLSLDTMIRSKTESVSSEFGSQYADVCEASFRQAIAPIEITVPMDEMTASPSAFLKEISSNGNMNTVDLIFQSWPLYINLNPEWWMLQLRPTLDYMVSGRWPKPWVIHDMGLHYPNATGHDNGNAEQMPLYETSTIFILFLAYQQLTQDTSYTQQYAHMFPAWADYLVANSLYPANQLISVDAIGPSPNQTALAIQAAIGLNAAGVLTGNTSYSDTANSFAQEIYYGALGLNGDTLNTSTHFTYNYGHDESWNVIFAAYSDVFLNLTTFPQEAWDLQTDWYLSQIQPAGLAWAGDRPYSDKNVDWALTDWNIMFASISSPHLQQAVINTTWSFMTNGKNSIPFGTKYVVEGSQAGKWIANKARSTVGTHFALAALEQGVWDY